MSDDDLRRQVRDLVEPHILGFDREETPPAIEVSENDGELTFYPADATDEELATQWITIENPDGIVIPAWWSQ